MRRLWNLQDGDVEFQPESDAEEEEESEEGEELYRIW